MALLATMGQGSGALLGTTGARFDARDPRPPPVEGERLGVSHLASLALGGSLHLDLLQLGAGRRDNHHRPVPLRLGHHRSSFTCTAVWPRDISVSSPGPG